LLIRSTVLAMPVRLQNQLTERTNLSQDRLTGSVHNQNQLSSGKNILNCKITNWSSFNISWKHSVHTKIFYSNVFFYTKCKCYSVAPRHAMIPCLKKQAELFLHSQYYYWTLKKIIIRSIITVIYREKNQEMLKIVKWQNIQQIIFL